MRRLFLLGFLAVACSAGAASEDPTPTSAVRAAIVGGRPSGDDENAAVFIVTQVEDSQLRCSGRIIAPGLVLAARHCFLKRRAENVLCNPDGTPVDVADAINFPVQPPESVSVFIGSNRQSQKMVAVREVIANVESTICRGDIAYLVLAEPGLDTRAPIRRAPPSLGEAVTITGWGYVDDTQRTTLPNTRSSVDTNVIDYGPPALPPGVFSIPGNTLCLGDSGAVALVPGGKVLGTYSRIDDPAHCQNEFGRNYLTAVVSEPELLTQAYAAIGETPWFDGEQKPWLAKAGSACATNDECASAVCENGACRAGCGPTGLACAIGQTCGADGTCAPDRASDAGSSASADGGAPAASPGDDGGCALVRPARGRDGAMVFAIAAIAWALRRARGARRSSWAGAWCCRRARR